MGSSGDSGPATSALFNNIPALGKDINGNLLIVDSDNDVIRQVSPDGIVTTFVGNLGNNGAGSLNSPRAVVMDTSANLYISDSGNYVITKITFWSNTMSEAVGQLNQRWSTNHQSTGTSVLLYDPFALSFGPDGTLYFADNFAGNNTSV